ncbi:hypothetical protein JHK87_001030 [Glycine soja]|nr:hypothetical protein JHK87_001030 [Glycine soja]
MSANLSLSLTETNSLNTLVNCDGHCLFLTPLLCKSLRACSGSACSSSSAHGHWLYPLKWRRWLPGSRGLKKLVHLWLQGVALASGIFGIWTKFQGKDGIVANFYSLHSWMGLASVSLFGAQWLIGFLNFWHRGEVRTVRIRILPWHVFLGLYTYALAIATAETGLLEKLTFLQTKRNVPKHSTESMVVNSLGLGLALLSGFVILVAVSPNYQILQSKLLYSETRCLSS